tara:strand:+ start:934 stop:1797 length:864 start_codon:yes stop_codon:yes gene_type:complete
MANTSQQEEPKANPYNQKKDWHKVDEKEFVSSDSLFFPEPEVEETSEKEKETKPTNKKAKPYSKPDYKKRYDDLKSHYDKKLNEFKTREQELIEEANSGRQSYKAPKTKEELEEFKKQYPDVYDVVETVSDLRSGENIKSLQDKISALEKRETEILQREAEKRLRSKHPDFDDIRNSEDFHDWAKEQPQSIQDWIYSNADDADLASRALDLFKKDLGITTSSKTKKSSSSKSKKSAADMVSTKTTAVEPKQAKIWTEREIAAMSMDEFDRHEEEIGQAISEGRVVKS